MQAELAAPPSASKQQRARMSQNSSSACPQPHFSSASPGKRRLVDRELVRCRYFVAARSRSYLDCGSESGEHRAVVVGSKRVGDQEQMRQEQLSAQSWRVRWRGRWVERRIRRERSPWRWQYAAALRTAGGANGLCALACAAARYRIWCDLTPARIIRESWEPEICCFMYAVEMLAASKIGAAFAACFS